MKVYEKYLQVDEKIKVSGEKYDAAIDKITKVIKSAKTDDHFEAASKMMISFYKKFGEKGMDILGKHDNFREYGIKRGTVLAKLQDKLKHQKEIVKHLDKLKKGGFK